MLRMGLMIPAADAVQKHRYMHRNILSNNDFFRYAVSFCVQAIFAMFEEFDLLMENHLTEVLLSCFAVLQQIHYIHF